MGRFLTRFLDAVLGRLRLERLGVSDAQSLSALERDCFADGWSGVGFMEALAGIPVFRAYGYRSGSELVAYVTLYEMSDEIEIINFGVTPGRRRQGLGKRLLVAVLRDGFERGILSAVLDVRDGNVPAIALYEGLGFVRVGRRKRYYTDTNEDALLYRLQAGSLKE